MQGPEDRLPSLGPPGILPPRDQDRGPGGKSCTSLQRTSRAAPRPRRVRGGPGTPSPPSPRPVQTPERRGARVFSGGEGGAAGAGAQPPYHLHLAGVELAGGRGHGELDLLAVLGVHGGRVVGGRGARRGVRGCGPGALLRAPRRQRAECGGEEQEGCSRTDKNTAPARGGGAGARGRGAAACSPTPPGSGARPCLGAFAPAPRAPRLAGLGPCLSPPSLALSQCLSALPLSPLLPLRMSVSVSASALLRLSGSHPPAPALGCPARPLSLGLAPGSLVGGLRRQGPMSAEERVLPGPGGGRGV